METLELCGISDFTTVAGKLALARIVADDVSWISGFGTVPGSIRIPLITESIKYEIGLSTFTPTGGTLRIPRARYNIPTESVSLPGFTPVAGTIRRILITYANWAHEPISISNFTPVAGTLQ